MEVDTSGMATKKEFTEDLIAKTKPLGFVCSTGRMILE